MNEQVLMSSSQHYAAQVGYRRVPKSATILCTISLAISYVLHLCVLICVQYRTMSTAMTRTES